MKIRNGFVSNSSSSSYIVSVPSGFMVTLDEINNLGNECDDLYENVGLYDEDTYELTQKVADVINEELAKISAGQTYYNGDYNRQYDIFWPLLAILENYNMIVMALDGPGGDGEDEIVPFKDKRIKK